MIRPSQAPVQVGVPELIPDLIGFASTVVLVLMLVALGAIAYKHLTGGIEWPEDEPEDDDGVREGGQDDEWDYY